MNPRSRFFTNPRNNYSGVMVERVNLGTGTATGQAVAWINPRPNKVIASVTLHITTAGTGTIDIGTGRAGTGTNSAILEAGTLAAGIRSPGDYPMSAITEFLIAASGSAGDSIVGQMSNTTASTAVGKAYIKFFEV